MIVFFSTAALTCAALIALNFLLRTVVISALMKFGAFDPRWDRYWPRFPWRPFWLRWVRLEVWYKDNFKRGTPTSGAASYLTQLALRHSPKSSLLGTVRLPLGIPYYGLVGEPSQRHKVYIASARSGKSIQLQVELALMPDDGAAVIVDPKGDHTHDVLYALERHGHELCVLDPLKLMTRPTQQINWIKQIDFINERLNDDRTTMIADRIASLSFPPEGDEKPFFRDSGRELWARLICFARLTIPNATMLDVRKLATVGLIDEADGDPKLAMTMLWRAMMHCTVYEGYVSQVGAQMLDMDEKTRSNVLATVRSRTAFWDHEQVKRVSRGNDVNLCDLKNPDKNLIVSFPVPVGDMKTTLKPWIGGNISIALAIMEWIPGDLKTKTKFVIEEAQAIGAAALPGLGDKAALMAGMGVSLVVVAQDLFGFRAAFPDDHGSILGNAQHVIFMACNEDSTYGYIADQAFGERTIKKKKWGMPFLWTVRHWTEPVFTHEDVRTFLDAEKNNAIVMRNGKLSMTVKIARSFKVLPVWMLDPNRDHGESFARSWFRSISGSDVPTPSNSERKKLAPPPPLLTDEEKLNQLALSMSNQS